MKVRPIHSNILVKAISENEITKSGIVLPDTMDQERPERGEVIAMGEGNILENGQRSPMSVKVGDKVMFKKYSPNEIKIDGEEFLIIKDEDVLAILE